MSKAILYRTCTFITQSFFVKRLYRQPACREKCKKWRGRTKWWPCHWVAVASDVHLGEGADVPDADHLHGEVPEEVDDLQGLVPQQEDEDEGRDDGAQQLLQDEHLHMVREEASMSLRPKSVMPLF